MASDKTLSQEEIDAIVGRDAPSHPEPRTDASPVFVGPSSPTPAAGLPDAQQANNTDALKSAMERIGQIGMAVAEARVAIQQMPRMQQDLQEVIGTVQTLSGTIQGMLGNLAASPTYGAKGNFTCDSCGTTGHVAVPVTCTKCGHNTWRGWWPQ